MLPALQTTIEDPHSKDAGKRMNDALTCIMGQKTLSFAFGARQGNRQFGEHFYYSGGSRGLLAVLLQAQRTHRLNKHKRS